MTGRIERAKEILRQLGPTGLGDIIAAALLEARAADPEMSKKLFHATIREVCRAATQSGVSVSDLLKASLIITEECHIENKRRLDASRQEKFDKDLARVKSELGEEGL